MRDALDQPVLGAEREGLADARLPDELLVEFADGGTALGMAQGVVAPVGYGPARGVEGKRGTLACIDGFAYPVEGEARLEIPDPGSRVAPGEHFNH